MSATGHLLPFDDSGEQPSERPLYFETCRKVNSHFSASAAIGRALWRRQPWCAQRSPGPSTR